MSANWVNRTMWTGDNLAVMRGLNSESVDLIYLDPPFNSNKTYSAPIGSQAAGAAFKDSWTLDDVDLAWHGEIAEQNPAVYAVIDAAGVAHGSGMKSYLIMMAVRLLEMHRLLKPTGSLYLHSDPTASHYLKLMLDAVFGSGNFRSEIIWKRTSGHSDARRQFAGQTDTLLFYATSDQSIFNVQHAAYSEKYIKSHYSMTDADGRAYTTRDLRSPHPRPNLTYDYKGYKPHPNGWSVSLERMMELDAAGLLYFPPSKDGRIRIKRYLDEMPGTRVGNLWDNISPINSQAQERVGYPTQKPLALLDRIVSASSNPGDVVLDPFAGCATACVSAETLGRQWIGIDLSPLAATLVKTRLREAFKLFYDVNHRDDIPCRTDLGPLPNYRTHRHTLFGKQEGRCGGCRVAFPFRNFTVDHVVPQSQGGSDHLENLQLLCGACNSVKGNRDHAVLIATLRERGVLPAS